MTVGSGADVMGTSQTCSLGVTVLCMLPLCETAAGAGAKAKPGKDVLIPAIEGPWWRIAGDPDLGEFTDEKQQPVDFGIWQAADGTWQVWSCIRHTRCGGKTRLFHRWEGQRLTDADWTPKGIAMQADPKFGETPGGLQAPHVIRVAGEYKMLYGDWEHICLATSADGKTFTRHVLGSGKTGLFSEAPGANTRDACTVKIGKEFYCYYTAHPDGHGAVYCRRSKDLLTWGESVKAAYAGSAGTRYWSAECPHVVYHAKSGSYYLFRTQKYGRGARTSVYRSKDPLTFGIDDDQHLVCRLPVAAPEIVRHEGRWYIVALLPSLKGIQVARLAWRTAPKRGKSLFDFDDPRARAAWKLVKGRIDPVFTTSTRQFFGPPQEHFIGTAESKRKGPDDAQQGEILSPPVTLRSERHMLIVSGGSDRDRVYVALEDAKTGEELLRQAGRNHNTFEEIVIDTAKLRGRSVRIRVVDRSTEGWGHINFGGLFECE